MTWPISALLVLVHGPLEREPHIFLGWGSGRYFCGQFSYSCLIADPRVKSDRKNIEQLV